jgi:hypothetical protein
MFFVNNKYYSTTSYKMAHANDNDNGNNPKVLNAEAVVLGLPREHGLHFVPCVSRGCNPEFCYCDEIAERGDCPRSILSFAGSYGGDCHFIPIFHACRACNVDATIQAIITNVRGAKIWFEETALQNGFDFGVVIEEPTENNVRPLAIELVNRYGKRD